MNHLTSDELIDAMEADADDGNAAGVLAAERRAHLDVCEECRRHLEDLAGVLSDAKQTSVPEPSPLFWNHLSSRVNEAIDREAARAWPQWLRWRVLLPLGALAMIIVALIAAVPRQQPVAAVSAEISTPMVAEDTWASFADLMGDLDIDVA